MRVLHVHARRRRGQACQRGNPGVDQLASPPPAQTVQELAGTVFLLRLNMTCPAGPAAAGGMAGGLAVGVAAQVHVGPAEANGTVSVLDLQLLSVNGREPPPLPGLFNSTGANVTGAGRRG